MITGGKTDSKKMTCMGVNIHSMKQQRVSIYSEFFFCYLDAEQQGTMRFNKGSATLNKFNPLPKIEEQTDDVAAEISKLTEENQEQEKPTQEAKPAESHIEN